MRPFFSTHRSKELKESDRPNDGFLEQLDVFYRASYKISRWNKAMRMYYLERALDEIISTFPVPPLLHTSTTFTHGTTDGDGSIPKDNMFAKFPRSPSDSAPATPGGSGGPRRRIRCKMCRQELAAREHMLDHGQVGPGTPASVFAFSPAASRRASSTAQDAIRPAFTPLASMSRRGSAGAGAGAGAGTGGERPIALATLNGEPIPLPLPLRRFSGSSASSRPESPVNLSRRPSRGARRGSLLANEVSPSGLVGATIPEGVAVDDSSAIADDDDDDDDEGHGSNGDDGGDEDQRDRDAGDEAELNGADAKDANGSANPNANASPTEVNAARTLRRSGSNSGSGSGSSFMSPMDLAAQLNAHPKLAALRSPALGGIGGLQPMTPLTPLVTSSSAGAASTGATTNVNASTSANSLAKLAAVRSPPLLINSTCSGYFLEPVSPSLSSLSISVRSSPLAHAPQHLFPPYPNVSACD